ncbi:MAG: hypothetical protein M1838_002869 [Thelocarpon superellum]|nr:MAG: hypothetical protein M1838_002869 [Thelocarpon superellum]
MADTGQTLNVPQLLAFMLISALAIRYFFFSPATSQSRNSSSSSAGAGGRRVDEAQVAQLQAMFPQLTRREIIWDLMRNGGSVPATTERVLTGRGLDMPPQSFQPPPPPPSARASTADAHTPPQQSQATPAHPDLITRYGLREKIGLTSTAMATATDSAEMTPSKTSAWSQNKSERQMLLQRRREEMILDARRKLQEKEQARVGRG